VGVVEGYSFPHSSMRLNMAGRHITSYVISSFSDVGAFLFS
jgi:actin-related protein